VIQQYLNLGVVDELEIALAPVSFGGGRRLFENLREPGPQFRIEGSSIAQPPRTCAVCVREGGLTTGCSGRSAARPAAEPEPQRMQHFQGWTADQLRSIQAPTLVVLAIAMCLGPNMASRCTVSCRTPAWPFCRAGRRRLRSHS
jgi:hypothetical protein